MPEESLAGPTVLTPDHVLDQFDCGVIELNDFLRKHALLSLGSGSARTYVASRGSRVVGYYSLAYGALTPEEAPERIRKGMPRHPLPVMLLARLAVDRSEQGRGLGKGLLKDALLRTAKAAEIAGLRALLVHAKDDQARAFYLKFDFEESPVHERHLLLLMKDLRRHLS
ncbi:MAG: GNAT family N-acetyltransferase [Opitutaceae bacterium]